jgi:NAD(P)-dependent dehydrogenase (short-subunit alcohol dehydrogenase family)
MARKSAELRGTKLDISGTALKRPGQPHDVATLVEFLLGDSSAFMTGGVINIDGGWLC